MKHATLIVMAKTATDSRNTASSVGGVTVNQRDALRAAKAIDGGASIKDGLIDMKHQDAGAPVKILDAWLGTSGVGFAVGHGVTIRYESGKTRFVRA